VKRLQGALIAGLLLGAALAAGCAVTPPVANESLEDARAAYRMASTDPQVQLRAPVELALAERELADAEKAWRDGAAPELVRHRAYLAQQRARIALRTADYRDAEARVATAGNARNRILLEARSREAENAREQARQAELARAEAERRADELARQKSPEAQGTADLGAELRRLRSEVSELKTRQTERGWVLTLTNELLFDSGRTALKPGGRRALDKLGQFMRRHPERDVAIEGFTDSTGSDEANRLLSERRALAVKQALVERGVERGRIDARGYGPAFPVASNDNPTGRQLNRRVEIIINPS
jgi:outer membrane protein OmpA-like peptidoglycan-associated protein